MKGNILKAFEIGLTNAINTYKTEKINLNFVSDSNISDESKEMTISVNGETISLPLEKFTNEECRYRRLITRILAANNVRRILLRSFGDDICILNKELAQLLFASVNYSKLQDIVESKTEPYLVGMLCGISVYIDPTMDITDKRVLVASKSILEDCQGADTTYVFYAIVETN